MPIERVEAASLQTSPETPRHENLVAYQNALLERLRGGGTVTESIIGALGSDPGAAIFCDAVAGPSIRVDGILRHEARHLYQHRTDEALHTNEQIPWQNTFEGLQKGTLIVNDFYNVSVGSIRHFEATPADAAHTDIARQTAIQAATLLKQYLPQEKVHLLGAIVSIIEKVNTISCNSLRRKVKFAVDRLLRDNEKDVVSKFSARQLLIASWQYIQSLENGPNLIELQEFWLSLSAYIDSGDYPNAPMGDTSTQAHFSIGVFAGDDEVKSDFGLHPACYGRMRNISSSMLLIHQRVTANQRCVAKSGDMIARAGKTIGLQRMKWTHESVSMLKIIKDNLGLMTLRQEATLLNAIKEGALQEIGQAQILDWLQKVAPSRDISSLQTSLYIASTFGDATLERDEYKNDAEHEIYFHNIEQGALLIAEIKQLIIAHLQTSTSDCLEDHNKIISHTRL